MERTSNEIREYIESLEADIKQAKEELQDNCKKIAKVAVKEKIGEIKHLNWMINAVLKRIDQLESYLKDSQRRLVRAIRIEGGYQEIVYFLETILESDIEWHKELANKYQQEVKSLDDYDKKVEAKKKWKKVDIMFAEMKEEEAKKVFQNDLDVRFEKLIQQLQDKVGNITEVYLQRNDNGKLDGKVTGEKGTTYLETITAGGYNIQRAHYRTLIK